MKTLIIYDDNGKIFLQMSGDYNAPQGEVHYFEVDSEIHKDKIIKSVDVETKELILEDMPKMEFEFEILQERINRLEMELEKLIETGAITEDQYKQIMNIE